MVIRPLASINPIAVEAINGIATCILVIQVVDGIIACYILLIEDQVIEADAVSQLKLGSDIPLILQINTKLVETYS
jgi:hypothetical protein